MGPCVGFGGYLFYACCLAYLQPLSFEKSNAVDVRMDTYEDVAARRLYDWHNCNPMKVLLSNCRSDAKPRIPYGVGKGYLQKATTNRTCLPGMERLSTSARPTVC